jgi:hypothetical protein
MGRKKTRLPRGEPGSFIGGIRSSLVDVRLQTLGQIRIVDVAGLLEGGETVRIEYFRPEVGVVTGRVTARENVSEVGAAIAGLDFARKSITLHGLVFEFRGVFDCGRLIRSQVVPTEIQQRSRDVLGCLEALVVGAGCTDLVDQFLRDHLVGFGMARIDFQHRRLRSVVLHELRRELGVVTRAAAGAGKSRVAYLRQQAVQAVAELVEQGFHLVVTEQRGFTLRRHGDVQVIGYDGPYGLALDI